MKMGYIVIGLVFSGALIFYLTSCKNKQPSTQTNTQSTGDTLKVHKLSENRYQDLRSMALNVTPEQLQLSLPAGQTKVFGVVMDWDMGETVATFISFETGDASMYLSSGAGVIGGSGHENVVNAAKLFVAKAQSYLDKASKTDTTPLPDKDCVRFYFLTNKGKFIAQEQLKNLDNKTSIWFPLFEEGNKVITELRLTEEKMKQQ
jgi:hypothetical protein